MSNFVYTPHSDKCYLATQGRSEYIVYGGMEMRDKRGRKYKDGRGHTWHRFRCNCIDCDSVVLVPWKDLMDFLAAPPGYSGGAMSSDSAHRDAEALVERVRKGFYGAGSYLDEAALDELARRVEQVERERDANGEDSAQHEASAARLELRVQELKAALREAKALLVKPRMVGDAVWHDAVDDWLDTYRALAPDTAEERE